MNPIKHFFEKNDQPPIDEEAVFAAAREGAEQTTGFGYNAMNSAHRAAIEELSNQGPTVPSELRYLASQAVTAALDLDT